MIKESLKKNLSSIQVLKTLQVLLQGNYTMQELINKLNTNEETPIFNNSVISKYINTCRYCGIDIPKIHNKYFVASMPFGLELTNTDITLLENLQNAVKENMTSRALKVFDSFVEKLNRYSNKKIARVEKNSYKLTSELFEGAVTDKRKINLMLKNKQILECIPLKMVENKGKTFFNIYYNNKERMIDSSRVSGIEILTQKFIQNFKDPSVIFVLKGDLAKRYTLRENEQLLEQKTDTITISNRGENKDILFSRLLRYDDKCEIINPKIYRDEMIQILNETLQNYGEV